MVWLVFLLFGQVNKWTPTIYYFLSNVIIDEMTLSFNVFIAHMEDSFLTIFMHD